MQPPSPGQLVNVRQRRFVVTEVAPSTLPPEPLADASAAPEHLVSLVSVEDDGLGEELQVLWELEPGVSVNERAELPGPADAASFDDPQRLDAFLDAVRWGTTSSADDQALHAPFRSGISIEEYQLDPVVRALQMPRVSLLLADDVGLGKTIEAGLVVQELLLRHRARSVLVVCPAALQVQWRDQMRDKFGLEFRIIDSEAMKGLRRRRGLHVNPWTHFPRLVVSIDYLKRDRQMRRFREVLPREGEPAYPRRFDLLIVDEAHNAAPSGRGHYAIDSLRTQAIRTLAPHFEHKLFLTATPHNGYPESFTALLELLDSQRFHRGVPPDRTQLGAVMVRRLKSELREAWPGKFPERRIVPLEVPYTDEERRTHRSLARYAELRSAGGGEGVEGYATQFVLKLLKKRMLSSPAAFLHTLQQHRESIACARKRKAPRPALDLLRRRAEEIEEAYDDDERYDEAADELLDASTRLFRPLTDEERALLEELIEQAGRAAGRGDSKLELLLSWLLAQCRPEGRWTDRRVILFTEYRATQKWLQQRLASAGFTGDRVMTIYGGMRGEEREEIKAAFQHDPAASPVRLLLATDAASEGIDLQNHCDLMVHYEIPWNPNRLEQRNGRIDRHGQPAPEVLIHHFVPEGFEALAADGAAREPGELEGDLEFLMRAALKVEAIREDLGKVGPVIASQVEEAMLGRRRKLDTAAAVRESEPVRRMLQLERKLRDQLASLRGELDRSRAELRLSPDNVRRVVEVGLELAGQPALVERTGRIFDVPALRGSWARCAEGLAHPFSGAPRPIVFDDGLVGEPDEVVLAHLNHRLVRMCLGLLRAEVWSSEGRLARVTARLVPDDALDLPAVVAHGRLLVLGGTSHRLHEELIAAGGRLRDGRLVRFSSLDEQRAIEEAALDNPAPEACRRRLVALWPAVAGPLLRALEARMAQRTRALDRKMAERAEREARRMAEVLGELRRTILAEFEQMTADRQQTFEFYDEPEREQFERNRESLSRRAAEIPAEIEQETARIRARYADPDPRLFPVAVTFLVPRRLAGGGF